MIVKDKLEQLDVAIKNLRQHMSGGRGFINREVMLNYLTDGNVTNLDLGDAIDAIYEESLDYKQSQNRSRGVLCWMAERFGNAEFFLDSDCPSRSKTGFKKGIGYWCTYSDILQYSEGEIKRFRYMGDVLFKGFETWFNAKGYELFTEGELATLESIRFNFHGESRSIETLRDLGVGRTTLAKIKKNKMLWQPRIVLVNGNPVIAEYDQNSTAENVTKEEQYSNRNIAQSGHKRTAVLEVNMSPDKVTRYLAMGIGEEVKQNIKSEIIASDSERLIRQRINHNALEMVKKPQPKLNKFELSEEYNESQKHTLRDVDNLIKEDPREIYNLSDNVIKIYNEIIFEYIMNSGLSVQEKLDLIDHVKTIKSKFESGVKF